MNGLYSLIFDSVYGRALRSHATSPSLVPSGEQEEMPLPLAATHLYAAAFPQ